jgi:hypothetical protein
MVTATIYSQNMCCYNKDKDDVQSLCGHEYFVRRRSQNFSTPARSFWLLPKHSSARHIGT